MVRAPVFGYARGRMFVQGGLVPGSPQGQGVPSPGNIPWESRDVLQLVRGSPTRDTEASTDRRRRTGGRVPVLTARATMQAAMSRSW